MLGIPAPLEIERKFLVEEPALSRFPMPISSAEIEQVYLISKDKGVERRVRKWSQGYS